MWSRRVLFLYDLWDLCRDEKHGLQAKTVKLYTHTLCSSSILHLIYHSWYITGSTLQLVYHSISQLVYHSISQLVYHS